MKTLIINTVPFIVLQEQGSILELGGGLVCRSQNPKPQHGDIYLTLSEQC